MSPALNGISAIWCFRHDQNTQWNNLQFLHWAATCDIEPKFYTIYTHGLYDC